MMRILGVRSYVVVCVFKVEAEWCAGSVVNIFKSVPERVSEVNWFVERQSRYDVAGLDAVARAHLGDLSVCSGFRRGSATIL